MANVPERFLANAPASQPDAGGSRVGVSGFARTLEAAASAVRSVLSEVESALYPESHATPFLPPDGRPYDDVVPFADGSAACVAKGGLLGIVERS